MRSLGISTVLGLSPAFAIGFGSFALLLALIAPAVRSGKRVQQPIAFNHAAHVANGLGCVDCHSGVESQAHATFPTLDTCLNCHQTQLSQSPEEAKLRNAATTGQPLRWQQLTRVPAHVYFSHRRHVQAASLPCERCHGQVQKTTSPPPRPFQTFTMTTCIQCHQSRGLRSDCNDCHR